MLLAFIIALAIALAISNCKRKWVKPKTKQGVKQFFSAPNGVRVHTDENCRTLRRLTEDGVHTFALDAEVEQLLVRADIFCLNCPRKLEFD